MFARHFGFVQEQFDHIVVPQTIKTPAMSTEIMQ